MSRQPGARCGLFECPAGVTKVEAPVYFAPCQAGAQEDRVLPQVAAVQVCDGLEMHGDNPRTVTKSKKLEVHQALRNAN